MGSGAAWASYVNKVIFLYFCLNQEFYLILATCIKFFKFTLSAASRLRSQFNESRYISKSARYNNYET